MPLPNATQSSIALDLPSDQILPSDRTTPEDSEISVDYSSLISEMQAIFNLFLYTCAVSIFIYCRFKFPELNKNCFARIVFILAAIWQANDLVLFHRLSLLNFF